MRAMPVVSVCPVRQLGSPLLWSVVGLGVSPFAQGSLDEAFSLAVGPRRIGPGEDVSEAEAAAGGAEASGSVARAVVGHDPFDGDAEACVVGDGELEKVTAQVWRSVFMTLVKAMREASSMAT